MSGDCCRQSKNENVHVSTVLLYETDLKRKAEYYACSTSPPP